MITTITKRDGRTVHFDINKIASAIEKAFAATIIFSTVVYPTFFALFGVCFAQREFMPL